MQKIWRIFQVIGNHRDVCNELTTCIIKSRILSFNLILQYNNWPSDTGVDPYGEGAIAPFARHSNVWFFINKRLFDRTPIYDKHLNEKHSLTLGNHINRTPFPTKPSPPVVPSGSMPAQICFTYQDTMTFWQQ